MTQSEFKEHIHELAQIRLTGKPEEIERIIQSFSKHYEVSYVSKEYGKTNPKYKYAKDSKEHIHENLAILLPHLEHNDDLIQNKKMLKNGIIFYFLYFKDLNDDKKIQKAAKLLVSDDSSYSLFRFSAFFCFESDHRCAQDGEEELRDSHGCVP